MLPLLSRLASTAEVGERYMHWDELRNRTPPQGLSHEQWWLAEKLSRRPTPLPLKANDGSAFWFFQSPALWRLRPSPPAPPGCPGSLPADLVDGGGHHLLPDGSYGLTTAIDAAMGVVAIRSEPERLEAAEAVLSEWEVKPTLAGSKAFHMPASDTICLPAPERFETAAAIRATWSHEVIHSTGHKTRLNRVLTGKMGRASYAGEELIAELGAFLLCRRIEVASCVEGHASYLSAWVEMLRESPRVLLNVLSDARKAADMICLA